MWVFASSSVTGRSVDFAVTVVCGFIGRLYFRWLLDNLNRHWFDNRGIERLANPGVNQPLRFRRIENRIGAGKVRATSLQESDSHDVKPAAE
jgi:hypothetical protein